MDDHSEELPLINDDPKRERESYVVHPLNVDEREYLVFGLSWAVVIGHRPDKEAVSRVRKAKATHYVPPGNHSSVVGYVKFRSRKKVRGELQSTWFSAAQIFADRFPNGVHAFVLALDDNRHWWVASQDGEVLPETDCVFDSGAEAFDALKGLREQYPNVLIASDVSLSTPSAASRLFELKHPLLALPMWVKLSACGLAAALVLGQGATLWQTILDSTRQSGPAEVVADASAAWKTQLDHWQKTIQVDGPTGFYSLLSQVGKVPLKLGGWPLMSLECAPYPAGWKCSAKYKRGDAGSSTNESLLADLRSRVLTQNWTVQWLKIDEAKVSWAFSAQRVLLDRSKLEDKAFIDTRYTSRVQAVWAAFKVAIAASTQARPDVPVPTYITADGQTAAIAYTDSLGPASRIPTLKGLQFDGPLASMTVLPLTEYSVIKLFSLTVADSKEPSIANNIQTASVTGVFYVK